MYVFQRNIVTKKAETALANDSLSAEVLYFFYWISNKGARKKVSIQSPNSSHIRLLALLRKNIHEEKLLGYIRKSKYRFWNSFDKSLKNKVEGKKYILKSMFVNIDVTEINSIIIIARTVHVKNCNSVAISGVESSKYRMTACIVVANFITELSLFLIIARWSVRQL